MGFFRKAERMAATVEYYYPMVRGGPCSLSPVVPRFSIACVWISLLLPL